MDKIYVHDAYKSMGRVLSEREGYNIIFFLSGNKAIKIFDYKYLDKLLSEGYDLEKQILCSGVIDGVPEIVTPNAVVYDRDFFAGYVMPKIDGIGFNKYLDVIRSSDICLDLQMFAEHFSKLEDIIRRSGNIVFPNLLEKDNIFYDNSNFSILNYDCIQVNGFSSPRLSNVLGAREDYIGTKYMNGNFFTKNLDIKSLIYLYFSSVFNCDLSKVSNIEKVFDELGLDDSSLYDKVSRLYDNDVDNVYLEDSLYDIASNYKMELTSDGKKYVKKA